jgi:hypothetical protein
MACPTTDVDRTRESRIARRFSALYRQFTLRPARLMTASQPSISFAQFSRPRPRARPSAAGVEDIG